MNMENVVQSVGNERRDISIAGGAGLSCIDFPLTLRKGRSEWPAESCEHDNENLDLCDDYQ